MDEAKAQAKREADKALDQARHFLCRCLHREPASPTLARINALVSYSSASEAHHHDSVQTLTYQMSMLGWRSIPCADSVPPWPAGWATGVFIHFSWGCMCRKRQRGVRRGPRLQRRPSCHSRKTMTKTAMERCARDFTNLGLKLTANSQAPSQGRELPCHIRYTSMPCAPEKA